MRELADAHQVSMKVVCEVMASLVEEGLLYTVPRVGTFVGRSAKTEPDYYLFASPNSGLPDYCRQIQLGFEERISALGEACFTFSQAESLEHYRQGDLPPLAGIFELGHPSDGLYKIGSSLNSSDGGSELQGTAYVHFGQSEDPQAPQLEVDRVQFDNVDGGAQATQHLLQLGHRCIAFLGLHEASAESERYDWSRERATGFHQVMERAGLSAEELLYCPQLPVRVWGTDPPEFLEQREAGRLTAQKLVARTDVTAVIVANFTAAQGYFDALQEAGIAPNHWPAVVYFDEVVEQSGQVVSYMRLPWDEVGRVAAQMLWERKNGRLSGPPQLRKIPMRLIPRLSSRPNWTKASSLTKRSPISADHSNQVI